MWVIVIGCMLVPVRANPPFGVVQAAQSVVGATKFLQAQVPPVWQRIGIARAQRMLCDGQEWRAYCWRRKSWRQLALHTQDCRLINYQYM